MVCWLTLKNKNLRVLSEQHIQLEVKTKKIFFTFCFIACRVNSCLFLLSPLLLLNFFYCPTRVGKAHGYLRWARSKYNKMWMELCSDRKGNVCVCEGKVVSLFVFNQSFFRYNHCVELFSINGFTFFFFLSEWATSFSAHFFPCVPPFAVGVASNFF